MKAIYRTSLVAISLTFASVVPALAQGGLRLNLSQPPGKPDQAYGSLKTDGDVAEDVRDTVLDAAADGISGAVKTMISDMLTTGGAFLTASEPETISPLSDTGSAAFQNWLGQQNFNRDMAPLMQQYLQQPAFDRLGAAENATDVRTTAEASGTFAFTDAGLRCWSERRLAVTTARLGCRTLQSFLTSAEAVAQSDNRFGARFR